MKNVNGLDECGKCDCPRCRSHSEGIPNILSTKEVAQKLKVSVTKVNRMVKEGMLSNFKFIGSVCFLESSIKNYIYELSEKGEETRLKRQQQARNRKKDKKESEDEDCSEL